MQTTVCVVLLTYNRSEALLAVLHGLINQDTIPDEVIISDDGSSPEHKRNIRRHLTGQRWPFKIKYIWHPDIGFTVARARNQAVFFSSSEYLIFLDGDCVPRNDFIRQHLTIKRPDCFVNGSRVLLNEALTKKIIDDPKITERPAYYWLFQRMLGRSNKWIPTVARFPRILRHASSDFKWKGIRSCNFSLERKDFYKVNGFDESFVGWGHEDADFVWRLQQAGCLRLNGHWATEVLHLWHKEVDRARESMNAKFLLERMSNHNARYVAAIGISEANYGDCELVYACCS